MGRGRAKAKQTKVARDLKYRTHETDFGALAASCTARPTATPTDEVGATTPPTSGRTTPSRLARLTPRPLSRLDRVDLAARAVGRRRLASRWSSQPRSEPDPAQRGRRRASGARRAGRRPSAGVTPSVPGQLEDRRASCRRSPDARCSARSKLKPVELVGDLDQAAGVHAVVGRVEDPAVGERLLDARVGELVVGGAADDLRASARRPPRRSARRPSRTARRRRVGRATSASASATRGRAVLARRTRVDRRLVDVGDHDLRAVLERGA